MHDISETDWIYPLKRKILFGIFGVLILFIVVAVFFIATTLRDRLIKDSAIETQELCNAVNSGMRTLMLTRNPDMIQNTIENIGKNKSSIVKAFILDNNGRIVYSSYRGDIGKTLDKYREDSCHGCHRKRGAIPSENTLLIEEDGDKIHRNIKVIYNEEACYGCHAKEDRTNGKLIIDRSLKETYSTIAAVEAVVFGSGLACIIFITLFISRILSKGVNKYIEEIVNQHAELKLLYIMIERLSKTIDIDELKLIVVQIMKESLAADEIDMVFHKIYRDYRVTSWSRGKESLSRKKIERAGPLWEAIERWINGKLIKEEVSDDGRLVYVPIRKGDADLALFAIRKSAGPFDPARLGLLKIMSSHISVAFENALLYQMAITDELTALYTQRYFRTTIDKKYSEYKKYGEKFALLILDIDNFKKVNDTYGHMVGDSILKGVARRVLISIRDNDLAFRYGGEEFAILLPLTDKEGAQTVAERVREEIADRDFDEGENKLRVTISIGVSMCPENAHTPRDLILTADQALYNAKHAGKNRVVISEVYMQ